MSDRDGGPAFAQLTGWGDPQQRGMTLRDYFAAQALTGTSIFAGINAAEMAKTAYEMADAMLEARKR